MHTTAIRESRTAARVLRANALFSAAAGLSTALVSSWMGDLLDVPPLLVAGVGLGLVGYAAALAVASTRLRPPHVLAFAAADAAWVVGTILLLTVLSTLVSPEGRWLLAVAAIPVAGFAIVQAALHVRWRRVLAA